MILFKKVYDGESIYDVERDVAEALDSAYNCQMYDVPQNKDGFSEGKFTITVEWEE